MRALLWLREETWEGCVDGARALLPAGAQVTLLHVAAADVERAARDAPHRLLGRPLRGPDPGALVAAASAEAAAALLEAGLDRLGRPAELVARRGRLEDVVTTAARGQDLLVCARDGDRGHAGPRSLAPATRFVVDHAPCAVLLVWPGP